MKPHLTYVYLDTLVCGCKSKGEGTERERERGVEINVIKACNLYGVTAAFSFLTRGDQLRSWVLLALFGPDVLKGCRTCLGRRV